MKVLRKSGVIVLAAGLLTLASAWHSSGVQLNPAARREASYTVHSHGMRVGELRTVCSFVPENGKKVLKFEATTSIHANLIVYAYDLDTQEEAFVGEEGTIRYQRFTRGKNEVCQVEGRLEHGRFLCDIRENGVRRTLAVERERYDFTTMECPEIRLKHEGDEMSLRLFDLETLAVVTRRYRWVKSEEITVDGKKIHCRVVDFEDPNKKCRRWIAPDEVGAIIARQDGAGKEGSYSLRLAHLKSVE